MEVHNQRQIVTNCPICAKTFTDPKILPCIHTLCSKCLESIASRTKKIPGDNMQCPVCTKEFSIPKEGLAKLQKNIFIERLVTLTGILDTNDRVCDACMEGIVEPLAIQAASVRSYCFNCSLKLCDDCRKHHRKSKLTENHRMVEIAKQTITVQLMELFAPSLCEQHKNEELKLYCTNCESSVCALCYIDNHQGHRFSEIRVAANEYRTKLQVSINDIATCAERIQPQIYQLDEHKSVTVKEIGSMKNDIERRRIELKRLVDKHADSLITKLGSLKEEKCQDIEAKKESIDRHNICLESYKCYTSELTVKATDTDICQAVKSITARALELKEMTDEITPYHHSPFLAAFWKANLEEFTSLDGNIVGTIQADKYDKRKDISKDRNAGEIKDLLMKVKQLTSELEIERSNIQKYQEKIENFSQELGTERTSKSSLQELVDQLKQNLTRETAFSRKHKELVETLQQDLQNERVRLRELIACKDASMSKVSEVEKVQREERQKWTMKEKSLSDKVTELRVDVAIANQATVKVQKQLEDERKEKTIHVSQIKQYLQNEREFNREKTEFVTKEKLYAQQLTCQEREMSQTMHKLKQEVASEQTICNSLKAERLELQEQQNILEAELQSLRTAESLQANVIRNVRICQERERKERTATEEKLRNVSLKLQQAEQKKLLVSTEHNTDKKKIQHLEEKLRDCDIVITSERQKFKERQTELLKLLFKGRPETIIYKDVKATTLIGTSLFSKTLTGLTIIENTLYITMEQSQVIESYEFHVAETLSKFSHKQNFLVQGLSDPRDIKGTKRECLYIFDQKSSGQPNEIVKVDLNLKVILKKWSVGDDYCSLSITDEGSVLLTVHSTNKLKEYTSDGQLIREITLSSEVSNPLHSLKLNTGHFVVSYCRSSGIHLVDENGEVGQNSGICIVDENGDVLRSFGEENESWLKLLSRPVCLAIDSSGSIMVADETSSRVLLLTSTLEFKGELVSRMHGLLHPKKIHLDESNGPRLFVVDMDQIHLVKFDKKKIQHLEEKLRDCDIVITSERQKFKKRQTELLKLLFKGRPEKIDYKDVQASVVISNSSFGLPNRITGLTIADDTLYATMEQSQVIKSYQFYDTLPTFHATQDISVAGLSNPRDIKGTKRDCLYILDQKSPGQPNEIVKVDLNLKVILKKWSVSDDYCSLSITDEGSVLLTVHSTNKLKEYTSDGQLIREITLSSEVSNPLNSLKLTSGHFVVSYCRSSGIHLDDETEEVGQNSGICIVDENGDVLRSFGEENKSWLKDLYRPVCLAIDSSGSIMVADERSGRVLLLTSTLEFKGELVSRKNGVCHPTKIHLDESNGPRLFVVDRDQIHLVKFALHPVTMIQNVMEKTVKCLAGIMPSIIPAREGEVNKNLLKALQSQGTLYAARAFEGLAFLFVIVAALFLFLIVVSWFQR